MTAFTTHSTDIVIVGAGIIGLAVARALSLRAPSLSLAIFDKERAVARHQTGHNSGVLHTGIYYRPGSLKAETCARGRAAMIDFCQAEGIAHEICGKIIVATRPEELAPLELLLRRAQENGVRAERVAARDLTEIEPEIAGISGLHVPDAGIVDYVAVSDRLKSRLEETGARFHLGREVRSFSQRGADIFVETESERHVCRFVVNCGGLQSDRLAGLCGLRTQAQIVPFRGEYYELCGEARGFVKNLVYPVADPEFPFLGVHFTRGIHGEVECGPNAVLNLGRETYNKGSMNLTDLAETLMFPGFLRFAAQHYRVGARELWRSHSKRAFLAAAQALIPKLEARHLSPAPAGIRAQAVTRDGFLLDDFAFEESEYVLNVVNAPSPAATASLQIGHHIAERVESALRDRVAFC